MVVMSCERPRPQCRWGKLDSVQGDVSSPRGIYSVTATPFCQTADTSECRVDLLLVMHHQETSMQLCQLGEGVWKPNVLGRVTILRSACAEALNATSSHQIMALILHF